VIARLRRKFVLVNMVFVMAVMVTVLIILYVSSYQSSQNSITHSLSMALSEEQKDLRPSIGGSGMDERSHSGNRDRGRKRKWERRIR
jgi:hypothetical protein